jgi:hypothetical protein
VGLIALRSGPFQIAGTDFVADFQDDQDFSGGAECDASNGAEAIFAIELLAGEGMRLFETGGLDVVIRILSDCASGASCALSSDSNEDVEFTASVGGWYYVVVEAVTMAPSPSDYSFTVQATACQPGPELTWAQCNDGRDNDCDTLVDSPTDVGCSVCPVPSSPSHAAAENTDALCSDGLDNDCNGTVDCADTGCAPGGAITVCYLEATVAACSDGVDNDGDGRVDCLQRACLSTTACRPATQEPAEHTAALCNNGLDDDHSGRADCDDSACKGIGPCAAAGADESSASCSDGVDNDGNGFVDCRDSDCMGDSWCGATENSDATCSDGIDNNHNGLVDCADPDCYRNGSVGACVDGK